MKTKYVLGIVAGIVMLQAGCTTQIHSLPMPADLQTRNKQGIPLYFGDESHPHVKTLIETKEVRARVARVPEGQDTTCDIAVGEALQKLRDYAGEKHANAVVNVTTRFRHEEITSPRSYMCGSSNNGSTIAVHGDIVVLDAQ
jgi:uncharacterized protein YbjQ (UPF0145 family)